MGEAAFACFYFLFAIMFATVNVIVQDVSVRSQMYSAVIDKYTNMPYKYKPEKHYEQISVPVELYTWLRQAYVPVTFAENPVPGDTDGYCTAGHPCYIDQGDCDLDDQCQTGLTCGDTAILSSGVMVNGNYWDSQDLMNWCSWQGTPVDITLDATALPPQFQLCTTSPTIGGTEPPCCWDDVSNDYITAILPAAAPSLMDATVDLIGRSNCPASVSANGDCCAKPTSEPLNDNETVAMSAAEHDDRAVTVGNFNRILQVRFTVKRYRRVKPQATSPAFSYLTPWVLSGGGSALDPNRDNEDMEDDDPFTGVATPVAKTYEWVTNESFAKAGGYVQWVNPAHGASNMAMIMERMYLDGIFDNRMATFSLDMLVYNGNADTFMHVAFQFVFDPSGACSKSTQVMYSNLKGLKGNKMIAKMIEYFFLIPSVLFFLLWEVKKISDVSIVQHFSNANSWVDMFSLLLCIFVLIMNFVIQFNETYVNFEFKLDDPGGFSDRQAYLDMLDLQALVAVQVYFVAVNLLMIFFRAVVLVTSLEGNLGLIIATLGQASVNIVYFSMTFMFLLVGFVAFAFFTFGSNPQASGMTTPTQTFFKTFAMLLGQQNYDGLAKADPVMAIFFFFAFYIMVLFVMLNMFISILLSGYDVCDFELKKRPKDKNLLKKVVDDFRIDIFGKISGKLIVCVGGTWTMCIKPFLLGIMSCFMDIIRGCDCGIRCPSPKRVLACLPCAKGGDMDKGKLNKEMVKEDRRGKKLMTKSKKLIEKLSKTDPKKSDQMKDMSHKVNGLLDDYKKRLSDAQKDASQPFEADKQDVEELRDALTELEDGISEAEESATIQERLCTLMFMVVFVLMLIMMTRGEDSFWVTKATRNVVTGETWILQKPLRKAAFSDIESMQEAGDWASKVLVDELYAHPACRVSEGTATPDNLAECDNGNKDMQLVQRLNNWNVGFLNTTFVRVTVQPACYVDNVESRWVGGTPYLRAKSMDGACAWKNCFAAALAAESECKNAAGRVIDKEKSRVSSYFTTDPTKKQYYNYSAPAFLGPFGLLGGFAVSLGTTKESAKSMMETLSSDMWFTKNSASVVFDWITYNGNLDMFTYNVITFSLLETGTLNTEHTTRTFPLNIQDGGGPFHSTRMIIMFLFIIYVCQVIYFIVDQIIGLAIQRRKCVRAKQPPYQFFITYYKSLWNRTDTLSLVITVASIMIYFNYMNDTFRTKYKFALDSVDKFQVPPEAVKLYKLAAAVDPARALEDDWYIFSQMENIGATYDLYLNLAAINAFFIAVKVVKYANNVKAFKIYASTLAEGSERMMYFASVILLLLVGWSLFFMVLFGVYDESVADMFSAITTCFTWMLGDFDLERMLAAREIPCIIFFLLFEVMMYFICINMFLATMLNTYSETVGKLEVIAERQKMEDEREHDFVEIEYQDKEELKSDLTIKKDDLGEVWVMGVKPGGKADEAKVAGGGPSVGNLVLKVNGDKQEWKEHSTEEEIIEDGINPDPRDGLIRVIFKAPRLKEQGYLAKMLSFGGQTQGHSWGAGIRPTVKTFWRKHGAVTWTFSEVMKYEKTSDEPEDNDGDADSQDGANKDGEEVKPEKNEGSGSEMKAVRARVKKKLDALLFSRAAHASTDGSDAFDIANMDNKGGAEAGAGEEAKVESDIEIDELRNRIEVEPVTGDEVWLDCLMTQIEHEMEDESVVTEVLRTADMQETHKGQGPAKQDSLNSFYRLVIDILAILECKAKQKWYRCLQEESQQRLGMFKKQNEILHDYACELEGEFADIMQKIQVFKAKKEQLIMRLSGLLDKQAYKHLDTSGAPEDKSHLTRLSIPWPDAMVQGGQVQLGNI